MLFEAINGTSVVNRRIEVTGHGRTQGEAEANAKSKLADATYLDDAAILTVGVVSHGFEAVNFGLKAIGGYLFFAWVFFVSFSARPISTILALLSIVAGCISFWGIFVYFFVDLEGPAPSTHPAFILLGNIILILIGSFLAAGVAQVLLPFSAIFETFERAFLRRLPFLLRAPIMVSFSLWPVILPVLYIGYHSEWAWQGVHEVMGTWHWNDYIFISIIYLVVQLATILSKYPSDTIEHEFTWYGAPIKIHETSPEDATSIQVIEPPVR